MPIPHSRLARAKVIVIEIDPTFLYSNKSCLSDTATTVDEVDE